MAGDAQGADESNLTREEGDREAPAKAPQGASDARACMPCRGSGKVISNLGGSPKSISCPWCEGAGVRRADIDAQATWMGRESKGDA